MEIKKILKLTGILILVLLFFGIYVNDNVANAQCTVSHPPIGYQPDGSAIGCCYGACASGYTQISYGVAAINGSGGTLCCATGRHNPGDCPYPQNDCNCLTPNCSLVSYVPSCNNCVRCVPSQLRVRYTAGLGCQSVSPTERIVTYGGTSHGPTVVPRAGYDFENFNITAGFGSGSLNSSTGTVTNVTGDMTVRANCAECDLTCGTPCVVPQPTITDSRQTGHLYTRSYVENCRVTFRCHGQMLLNRCTPTCRQYWSGVSSTYNGVGCILNPHDSRCPTDETYYMREYQETPTAPTNLSLRIDAAPYVLLASGELEPNGVRIPYPGPNAGVDGTLFRLMASGSNNWRQNDPHYRNNTHGTSPWINSGGRFVYDHAGGTHAHRHLVGTSPLLQYRYSIFRGGSLVARSSWRDANLTSHYPNGTAWDVRLNPGLQQGDNYTASAEPRSANRCDGHTVGPDLRRSFLVNYMPEVISIEPFGNDPNLGVSGNNDWDASNFSPNNDGTYPFADCDNDNPKIFEVVFRDRDGCGDINPNAPVPTNIWVERNRDLRFRLVNKDTNVVCTSTNCQIRRLDDSISCSGNQLTVHFEVTFRGNHNVHYRLEAYAQDILGNRTFDPSRNSNWVHPGLTAQWSYDGRRPDVDIEVTQILTPREFLLKWRALDFSNDLSGVRHIRSYAMLEKGDILIDDDDYSSIEYVNDSYVVPVHQNFSRYVEVTLDSLDLSAAQARDGRSVVREQERLINLGTNQNGHLSFMTAIVDRACNLNYPVEELELGTPWIATRGGFVYSRGSINLAKDRNVQYQSLGNQFSHLGNERLSLSTDWLVSDGTISATHPLAFTNHNYTLPHRYGDAFLFQHLRNLATIRDPEGEYWSDALSPDLSVCVNSHHVYFVDGDLDVQPNEYEGLAQGNISGCIFVVSGNIRILEGEYKSAGHTEPRYDVIRGFFIADGEINIEFVDEDEDVRDGLKVVGSLMALNRDGSDSAVRLRRSLQLRDNLLYPTLIIFHDPRYGEIAREILGETLGSGHIRDIGLKE
jgi:hypothetical protein